MELVAPPNPHGTPLLRILALLAFALVIVVLSSLGTYWYLSRNITTQESNPPVPTAAPVLQPTIGPTSAVSLTPAIDPATGWKIYENKVAGLTIEYPNEWKLNIQPGLYKEKGFSLEGKEGYVDFGWNNSMGTPDCSYQPSRVEDIQLKNQIIKMCHFLGTTQQPEQYHYNFETNNMNVGISLSFQPRDTVSDKALVLKVLSTLSFQNPIKSLNSF